MEAPETRYARRPDGVSIAYQAVGDGPIDLLLSPGFVSHLELQWTDPAYSHLLHRLGEFARLILYDKPGTGLSDPIPHVPSVEERMADIGHVLDAAGSTEAVLFGISEGGPASILFAATHPGRVRALALYGTFAVVDRDSEVTVAAARRLEDVIEHWGDGDRLADIFAPGANRVQRRLYGTFARAAASPGMAAAVLTALEEIDVTAALGSITAPTLVMHRTGDLAIPCASGRAIAEAVAGGRFVELSGEDHVPWLGDTDAIVGEVESFLTGARRAREPDRMLATVLFTDICGSTQRAAELGDAAWRELLVRHDAIVREHVERFGGRVVKSLGDGVLATFDGPARGVRCARMLCEAVRDLGIEIRAGLHTGELEVFGDDVGGMAVHLGARVSALAGPGEVLVSSTVKDLVVGSELFFEERGEHELKGVPGRWRIHALGDERRTVTRDEPLGPARDHMRMSDKIAVRLAGRAPTAMRAMARLGAGRRGA